MIARYPHIAFVFLLICFFSFGKSSAQQVLYGKKKSENRASLSELCLRFGTDKCAHQHNFIEIYESLFTPLRDSVNHIFEIGIFHGASHRLWKAFFSKAEVYGIDIYKKKKLEKEGIHTYLGDQANRTDLQGFVEKYNVEFDIILDDGGHAMSHQQVSLAFLFKHLKSGGYYIIEDVHTSLPDYYPDSRYGVNPEQGNTTLKMIEDFIRTSELTSTFMTEEEMEYIQANIDLISLSFRTNSTHSIVCVIKKK